MVRYVGGNVEGQHLREVTDGLETSLYGNVEGGCSIHEYGDPFLLKFLLLEAEC